MFVEVVMEQIGIQSTPWSIYIFLNFFDRVCTIEFAQFGCFMEWREYIATINLSCMVTFEKKGSISMNQN